MQATCAEHRVQFGGNNERFSDCWLSQDEGRSWSQQLETPPWAARWGMGMAALPSGALVLARGVGRAAEEGSLTVAGGTAVVGHLAHPTHASSRRIQLARWAERTSF